MHRLTNLHTVYLRTYVYRMDLLEQCTENILQKCDRPAGAGSGWVMLR